MKSTTMKKYFKFSTRFRNQTYEFVVEHASHLKMTGSDIQKIVSEKFKTTIPQTEISYNETEISSLEYQKSKLDKHTPELSVSLA